VGVYRTYGVRNVVYGAAARIFQRVAHIGESESGEAGDVYFKGEKLFLCKQNLKLQNQIKLN
jgi:hypothetical protein